MGRAHRLHAACLSAVALTSMAAAGCGDDDDHANELRPPVPITVTAYISQDEVSISPSSIGAGPVTVLATNQTGRSQELTLETADAPGSGEAGIRQQTGPINPNDTGELRADVDEGTYEVRVGGDRISSATLEVGPERPSSQQDLMLP